MKTTIAINHVGLTVSNIEEAIDWYSRVFGFELIIGPLPLQADDSHFGQLALDILGSRLNSGQFAHLKTGNGVGIELFSFDDPEAGRKDDNMEYWKNGIFHFAITDPNPEEVSKRILANGGKQRTKLWDIFPGGDRQLVYCEDPWGNIIEIYSHSYTETWNYLLQTAKEN
ncbi:VOC family protein [Flagellimonas meridianipacifica]|uniref:Catechol 2,3-dioxygenase-like lactoylglutathione lyase family enzyme n=1 Tax=Flagellimonas meridianipacifica TaxID=1080225 RepID=A0A2T0MCZ6_9FLAO|nr:VOC family protein [Allomuricauda pacifica]PRX55370.1 catechol 2,3-dioxygenase-like lactoylglutathione lyase family enzyme [Allomuricauda pacifica]